ncbi:hypothetical protein OESDEN_10561 [Oesophagostomum dentatum]|uniref:Uncharacterized protein n=1 Tax=Oesophagostomum dentatum TaxID=61180 RepID=A0A0B1T2L7_OESDE|nr:hypothetical protein OESDEN_10561 [Oesophagostomum dentatum]
MDLEGRRPYVSAAAQRCPTAIIQPSNRPTTASIRAGKKSILLVSYSLTEEPDKLRVCFEKRRHFVDEIINCFKTKIKA